ncbi:YbaB/EbfC family nucleoid-associated protein [Micromonospora sp. WMMD812]|uniref:YbaB/EbfC family nucleoid-associated protein n=1 Tax=Micromonospora sp. WMMD812 TaxID=3015152 RepID=UPI00248CB2C4|nr:YbaB/EbfC family nucleoid-associated protein [Micromonospora sp. WMMD812]WBB65959.1 YbaB/EbfC family nucleoid-associated protein [Micromonospora sp. WMMD812]
MSDRGDGMGAGIPGTGGLLDPDGAMERLAEWKGRIDRLAADTRAMNDRLQDLRVTTADGNGLAEVTVDSAGALVDLRLGQRIHRVAPDVVARTIMDTIRVARQQLADRAQEIIADTVGTESAAARAIAERVGQQLRDADPTPDGSDDRHRSGW